MIYVLILILEASTSSLFAWEANFHIVSQKRNLLYVTADKPPAEPLKTGQIIAFKDKTGQGWKAEVVSKKKWFHRTILVLQTPFAEKIWTSGIRSIDQQ